MPFDLPPGALLNVNVIIISQKKSGMTERLLLLNKYHQRDQTDPYTMFMVPTTLFYV